MRSLPTTRHSAAVVTDQQAEDSEPCVVWSHRKVAWSEQNTVRAEPTGLNDGLRGYKRVSIVPYIIAIECAQWCAPRAGACDAAARRGNSARHIAAAVCGAKFRGELCVVERAGDFASALGAGLS